jgi:hypothetical protein
MILILAATSPLLAVVWFLAQLGLEALLRRAAQAQQRRWPQPTAQHEEDFRLAMQEHDFTVINRGVTVPTTAARERALAELAEAEAAYGLIAPRPAQQPGWGLA